MKKIWVLVLVLIPAALLLPQFFLTASAGEYADCGHRVVGTVPQGDYSQVWFTSDPAEIHSEVASVAMGRGLVVASSSVTLTSVLTQNVWSCYVIGEMTRDQKWDLLEQYFPDAPWYVEVDVHGDITTEIVDPEVTWTPEPTPETFPAVVEFNVNSPDGFGQAVTATRSFDLLAVVWPQEVISDSITLTFSDSEISSSWYYTGTGTVGEWSAGGSGLTWTGYFPVEGPIEVWVSVPEGVVSFRESRTFNLEVVVGDFMERSEVNVTNPNWGVFLPLVFSNSG
jgi:hypothetical protein